MTQITQNAPSLSRWLSGYRLALLFFAVACLFYGPLYGAGFVTDFTGWLECREDTPFWLAYHCFGNRGLYFIPFIVLEFLTASFWLHPLPWFLVWTGLHAFNTWLVVDISRALCRVFQVSCKPEVPLLAGLFFLIHPWQVEVLAWKACVNYLTACLFMLLVLRYYIKSHTEQGRWKYWISVMIFIPFLFALEFALVFPLILMLLYWGMEAAKPFHKRLPGMVINILPFILAIGLWLIANKFLLGIWIGHYGSETHLNLHPAGIGSAILKYAVKIFFLSRLFSFPLQTKIYGILDSAIPALVFLTGLALLAGVFLIRVRRMTPAMRFRTILFFSGMILILPIANLYFYYLQYSENDRYTYLAIAFLGLWVVHVLWNRRHWIGKAVVLLFLVTCAWGTVKMVRLWEQATQVYWKQIETFPRPDKPVLFLLNVPDNYKGIFMYRNFGGDSAFGDVYRYISRSGDDVRMYDIFQYNMTYPDNGVQVSWESENRLKVEFTQWGNWWWRNGIGAERYGNDEYTAWPEGHYYLVEFKNSLENAEILYATPGGWQRVKPMISNRNK